MRSNLDNLINTTFKVRLGDYVHASTWRALRHMSRPQVVVVYHHTTVMFEYDAVQRKVTPLNSGWGSRSDKDGVRKILAGVGIHTSYKDLYVNK